MTIHGPGDEERVPPNARPAPPAERNRDADRARTNEWTSEPRYVFSLSVRLVHWTLFFSLIALSLTGYWIGSGNMPGGPGGAFQMGSIRYVHTLVGWVFFAALLVRLYCFVFGNAYARWRAFVPHTREHFRELGDAFLYYAFFRKDYPHMGFGHNRLAAATYLVVYLLLFFMVVSGLALHGMAFPMGWQARLTWPLAFVGPQALRLLHHVGMWLIWGFVVHHVASAVLVDHEMRGGLMGGIFSGWKVVRRTE